MSAVIGFSIGVFFGALLGLIAASAKVGDIYSELVDVSNEKHAYEEAYYELSRKVRSVSAGSDEHNLKERAL